VLLNTLRGLALDVVPLVKEEKKTKGRKEKLLGEDDVIEIKD